MGKHDTHWVRADDIADVLDIYVEKHMARFPTLKDSGRAVNSNTPTFYGPLQYLANQMTQSEGTFRGNYNKLERIRKRKSEWLSLSIADHILIAMGDVNTLNEIPVFVGVVKYGQLKPETSMRIAVA